MASSPQGRVDLGPPTFTVDAYRGGQLPLTLTLTINGVAVDASLDTVTAMMRRDEDDAAASAFTMTVDTTDEATGVFVFDVADDDAQDLSGVYVADVRWLRSGETRPRFPIRWIIDFGRNVTYT